AYRGNVRTERRGFQSLTLGAGHPRRELVHAIPPCLDPRATFVERHVPLVDGHLIPVLFVAVPPVVHRYKEPVPFLEVVNDARRSAKRPKRQNDSKCYASAGA